MNIAVISFQANTDIIGAKYIHAYLRQHNHNSYLILQCNPDNGSDISIFKFIFDNNIELVGISLMSNEFFRARQFAEKFKSQFNDIPIVFGGIHATIAPEECLSIGDIVIRGEGEYTLLELVHCLKERRDFSELPGICLKHNGQLKSNLPRSLETDIDKFPFPRHLPENMFIVSKNSVIQINKILFNAVSRYGGTFPNIITSRGCPFSCTYCCNSALKDLYVHYPVRKRSVEFVISEILEIIAEHKNCLSLNIQDDCFLTYDNDWIAEFSRQYRIKINIPFIIRATPRHINRENLILLKEAGLIIIMMGLQTGSDRVNKEVYKRHITNSTFLNAANIIKEVGLAAYYDIILDNPYETEEDTLQTLRVVLQIPKPFQLQLFSLCFYQGTELHRRAVRDNVSFMDPRVDDYGRLFSTALNKLISMTPTIHTSVIKYFIKHRTNRLMMGIIDIFAVVNTAIFKPVSYLWWMHSAYGSKLFTTFQLIKNFYKTAIRERLKCI